jgi:pantoate--beta-alanine ligase
MQIVNTVTELRKAVNKWRLAGERIAFVPTMGNLHNGHLKLVTEAKRIADHVVVSIFVNPTQFGPGEDFASYPRTELADQAKLATAQADLLFMPSVQEMYPDNSKTVVSVADLSDIHCGAARPGHFNGVTTVVCKLFNMVQPDVAVFGLKDFQQFTIIKTMVRDLNLPVEMLGIDTVREESGLAMSSRNGYLSEQEKTSAAHLYQSLCAARDSVLIGNDNYSDIEQKAKDYLNQAGLQPEYFSICRSSDLLKADVVDQDLVILTAAKMGRTRLIDNVYFSK